jgi:glutathione S-transferase
MTTGMTLELYHNDMSVCAQKVRVALAEKLIAYTGHALDIRAGETHTPEYRALNPKGVVPTLVIDGAPIVESTIICEYLDDAFPDVPLRPADAAGRAAMRQWTIRPDTGMHKAFGLLSFAVAFRHQDSSKQMENRVKQSGGRKPPEAVLHLMDVIAHGLDSVHVEPQIAVIRQVLADMAARLEGHDWLAGDCFSLADIAMLPYICRLRDLGQTWVWAEGSAFAAVGAWLDRCYARPGYAGIADFLNDKYLAVMAASGRDAEPKLRAMMESKT